MKSKVCNATIEPPPVSYNSKKSYGFTVIELLTVLLVVTLLFVLIYPVTRSAVNAAQNGRCIANQRTIGGALLSVAADNGGRLPALGHSAQAQQPTWGMAAAEALEIDLEQRGLKTPFWCPADRTAYTKQGLHMQKNHVGHSSYAVNVALIDWQNGSSALGGPARGGARLGEIARASSVIMGVEEHHENNVISWADHGGRTSRKGWTFEYTFPNGTVENDPGKRGYHQGKNNWLFADGHVEHLSFEETIKPVDRWEPEH